MLPSQAHAAQAESSPIADLIRNILGSVAEFERGLIAERVKAGLYRAREQGKVLGRPCKLNGEFQAVRDRIRQGVLTQAGAARELGVSEATVSRMMHRGARA